MVIPKHPSLLFFSRLYLSFSRMTMNFALIVGHCHASSIVLQRKMKGVVERGGGQTTMVFDQDDVKDVLQDFRKKEIACACSYYSYWKEVLHILLATRNSPIFEDHTIHKPSISNFRLRSAFLLSECKAAALPHTIRDPRC